jgi:hypothetical protein
VEEREYDVKYQNTLFRVYAKEGEDYDVGDVVYVKIPETDFSQKIYIEGLVTANTELPIDKTKIIEVGEEIEYSEGLTLPAGFYKVSADFKNGTGNKEEYKLKLADDIFFGFQDFTGNPFLFNNTNQFKYINLINSLTIQLEKVGSFEYSNLIFTPCEIVLLNENEAYLTIYTPKGNKLDSTNGT